MLKQVSRKHERLKSVKLTANDSKFHFSYLNKLVDQYKNNYYHSIDRNPVNAYYYVLTEK